VYINTHPTPTGLVVGATTLIVARLPDIDGGTIKLITIHKLPNEQLIWKCEDRLLTQKHDHAAQGTSQGCSVLFGSSGFTLVFRGGLVLGVQLRKSGGVSNSFSGGGGCGCRSISDKQSRAPRRQFDGESKGVPQTASNERGGGWGGLSLLLEPLGQLLLMLLLLCKITKINRKSFKQLM
jgi:hypothetical protein